MRFVYSDEAGISRHEPATVVVGVVLEADSKWDDVTDEVDQIRRDYAPTEPEVIFHATDMFSGRKAFKNWTEDARWTCMERLAAIPRRQKLALCVGFCKRSADSPDRTWKEQLELDHMVAFAECMVAVEEFMATRAVGEVAAVVAEDNADMRLRLRDLPQKLRRPETPDILRLGNSIKDTIHFCPKDGAPILQIADACAFFVRRYLTGLSHGDHFFDVMMGMSVRMDRNLPAGHYVWDWNTSEPSGPRWKKMFATKVRFPPTPRP